MIEVDGVPIFAPVTKTRVSFTGSPGSATSCGSRPSSSRRTTTKLVFYYRLTKVVDGATVALGTDRTRHSRGGREIPLPLAGGGRGEDEDVFSENPGVVTDGRGFDAKL